MSVTASIYCVAGGLPHNGFDLPPSPVTPLVATRDAAAPSISHYTETYSIKSASLISR